MKKFNIFEDIEGVEFPAGRKGRVMYGENGKIDSEYFVQGYSVVYPGGSIPIHNHETIETYTILSGSGEMYVGEETSLLKQYQQLSGNSIQNSGNPLYKGNSAFLVLQMLTFCSQFILFIRYILIKNY